MSNKGERHICNLSYYSLIDHKRSIIIHSETKVKTTNATKSWQKLKMFQMGVQQIDDEKKKNLKRSFLRSTCKLFMVRILPRKHCYEYQSLECWFLQMDQGLSKNKKQMCQCSRWKKLHLSRKFQAFQDECLLNSIQRCEDHFSVSILEYMARISKNQNFCILFSKHN